MRDLLFKNLTSNDKRRKIITSSETVENQGVRSVIRRHLVCIVKEVKSASSEKTTPDIHVIRERNTREGREKFFFRIKGSVYAVSKGRLFLIVFAHSLRICLIHVASGTLMA